jgi:hypothetical protein
MQTQLAISPLTGPGTGRLKLSACGSKAYSSRIPVALRSQGYSNAISPRIPSKPAPNPNRWSNLAVTPLD